jgi:hypothetical protein
MTLQEPAYVASVIPGVMDVMNSFLQKQLQSSILLRLFPMTSVIWE